MNQKIVLAALIALAAPAAAMAQTAPQPEEKAAARVDVDAIVARMQAFYEKTASFDTRFEQRFQQGGMPSRFAGASATGRLRFRKPKADEGPRMRWDYEDGRILLLVGDRSFTYDPDTRQATEYRVDAANLSAAVTFMWGEGRLTESFTIAAASRADLAGEGIALELTPREKGQGFSKVFLVVDPASGQVLQSVVVQANGSENRLRFHDAKVDVALDEATFDPARAFPEGTTVTKANVPGQN